MKKNTKILFLIILMFTFSLVFTACNGTKDDNTVTEVPQTTEPSLPSLGTFVSVVPKTSDIDYTSGNEIAKQKIIDTIANDKGVLIDFEVIELDEDNFTSELNDLLSSSTYVDSITTDYDMIATYASVDGLVQPLDSLLQTYGPNLYSAIDESYWEKVKYNGEIYGIPSIPYPEKSIMVARSDQLYMFTNEPIASYAQLVALCRFYKNIGYKYPLAMTWDQLIDVLALTFRVAPEQYGAIGQKPYTFVMREQTENYKKYFLEEIKILYENGYIHPDIFTATEEQMKSEFMAGRSAIYVTEYDNLFSDRAELKSVFSEAEMLLIPPLTSRFYSSPAFSGEEAVDKVLMITANSQNSEALISYLDWVYTSQLNLNMTKLGAYGQQVMYNPALNEYEYLDGYTQENKPYNGLYTLGLSTDFLYAQPTYVEYTIDIIANNSLQRNFDEYMKQINVRLMPKVNLNKKAEDALNEYTQIMRTGAEKYIKGEIDIDEYNQYERQSRNNGLLDILTQEIGVEYLYKLNN
ncbi:MAG: hypothetical protein AB1Z23_09730 [Eubacteriales bacterium]